MQALLADHRPRRRPALRRPFTAALLFVALALPATLRAQNVEPVTATAATRPSTTAEADAGDATVVLAQRKVVRLRATVLGDSAAERAAMARDAIETAAAGDGPGLVAHDAAGDAVRFAIDGRTVFFLVPDDLGVPRAQRLLDAVAQDVARRLQTAVQESRELRDPRRIAVGAAQAAGALAFGALVLALLFGAQRRVAAQVAERLEARRRAGGGTAQGLLNAFATHGQPVVALCFGALAWGAALLVVDLVATFVLHQFAYTRPWGERSTTWLLQLLRDFALATAGAVPGLLTALLIFALARLATRVIAVLMRRVERGELRLAGVDADTAGPTRRLGQVVVWLFALVMAYPYLPGAGSEAFKGVSVLAGLMLSLGASSVVGQAMSGLSLMYGRVMRPGEYVRIGDTEGTVTALGLFATKLHTGLGEEVSLPNATVFSQAVRNFSRLAPDGGFVLHTAVTIGYATPWRQVHAMLLQAARETPGIADTPAPYVVQTALSDFYVEYRLCAHSQRAMPERRAETMSRLHGRIQDVFNANGVQIMSPHYLADPPRPQVVAAGAWQPSGDALRPPAGGAA